jgi:A/G-specific adenine glycosylase
MLQQTTVATVETRFHLWMTLFPSIHDLANAPEEAVMTAWQGLGYYARARRLQAAARMIVQYHAGVVPKNQGELLALPGIGEYTASAILAFAYNQQAVVLDTNISRVIARWSNLTIPLDTAAGKKSLIEAALPFFSHNQSRKIAAALMDLGAMICIARTPHCSDCPLQASCRAETPESLPLKSPRRVTTKRTEHRAWIVKKKQLFLELSLGPLWQGLWILPRLTTQPSGRCIAEIIYPITRYRVTMKLYPLSKAPPTLMLKGFYAEELEGIPLPSPHRRAIAATGFLRHTPH